MPKVLISDKLTLGLLPTVKPLKTFAGLGNGRPCDGCGRSIAATDHDAREVLEVFLTSVGATVTTASNGEDALKCFQAAPPAVVLTDIKMPRRDGLWLLEQIRSVDGGPPVRVVAITGRAMLHERQVVRTGGFRWTRPKPVDLDDLVDMIAAFTGR